MVRQDFVDSEALKVCNHDASNRWRDKAEHIPCDLL